MDGQHSTTASGASRTYRWPWFVLAAAALGFALAFLWMSHEVQRTRQLRDTNAPPSTLPAR